MKILFVNAKVWLGKNIFADSIGIDSTTGKIIFIGSNKNYKNVANEYKEIIDLKNKVVLPSFIDGHCHFRKGALVNTELNLRNAAKSIDFINGINNYKINLRENYWIEGGYFSEANFKEHIPIDKNFLDQICADYPIVISRFDLHSAYVNSKVIEILDLKNKIQDFSKDEIILDSTNQLTGEIKERARDFVIDQIPQKSLEEKCAIAKKQISKLHSLGITAISDITLPEDLPIYKKLLEAQEFNLRIDPRLPFQEFRNLYKYEKQFELFNDKIKFNSFKAFYDGSLSSKTALFEKNYKGVLNNGLKTDYVSSGEFESQAFEIDKFGYQISVHAIGDKAISELLNLNVKLNLLNGKRDRRFRIEHAQHIHEKDFSRFKDLNVIASVQPAHLFSDAKTSVELLEDYKSTHNYKKLFDIGAKVCFGTDFPIVNENPFETIYYAMTRKAEGFEKGFINENRINLINCLEAYTINNAYAMFQEKNIGSLEVNKSADLIVLEEDIFTANENEIKNISISMTYLNGERVY